LHNDKTKELFMKKILFAILTVLTVALTACSTSLTSTSMGATSSDLPVATQLAVGTLKLTGTSQTVTAEQARDLLVYWETYKQLNQSDTAAQAEFDGLTAQIEETLTTDQMQAITDMNITQKDVFTAMQGVTTTVSGSASSSTASVPAGSSAGAGMPAGGPPADGGTPPEGDMGGDLGGAASGASQTQGTQSGTSLAASTQVPTTLVEAVIESLRQIIAA
jgi:hypothetical protein